MADDHGMVRTRQRSVLLDELRKMKTHPTADELYLIVRETLPRISLGTVYRNLELLCAAGVVRRVHAAGERMRFDADCSAHSHIRCSECGRVDDVPDDSCLLPACLPAVLAGYEVRGAALEIEGLCPNCRQAQQKECRGI